jgi:Uma2 family endonuclease
MGQPLKEHTHYTYRDYLGWPDDVRYELIDGVAYLMAPAPRISHQTVAGEIYFQLRLALDGKPCTPLIAPVDVSLPRANEADEHIDSVVQPDVFVVCDPAKISERGVRGAPDLVIEVLSPATAAHDQIRKRDRYERAGVAEYWLVHPTDRVLTVYTLIDGLYGKPAIQALEGETASHALAGVRIQWDALVARLPVPDAG